MPPLVLILIGHGESDKGHGLELLRRALGGSGDGRCVYVAFKGFQVVSILGATEVVKEGGGSRVDWMR